MVVVTRPSVSAARICKNCGERRNPEIGLASRYLKAYNKK